MPNAIKDKSFAFAVAIVRTTRRLQADQREYVLSKQLLRSGTAIGALVREAQDAESRADFIHKLAIALKEANETAYRIDLMRGTRLLQADDSESLGRQVQELLRLLTAILKSTKGVS